MKRKKKSSFMQNTLPLIDQFIDSITHLEKSTSYGHRKSLISFVTYLNKKSTKSCFPNRIKKETIASWATHLKKRYSFSTVMKAVRIVVRFLSFLENKGLLKENYLGRMKAQYPKRGLTGIISALLGPSPQKSLQALKIPAQFISPFGPQMQNFIDLARAQGKKYKNEEEILLKFDCFLSSYAQPPCRLSDSIIRKWLASFPAPVRANRYLGFHVVRRFCLYLRRLNPGAYLPDLSLAPPWPPSPLPYIYSRHEIAALLRAASKLKSSKLSPILPNMVYMLILLLYTTGMRLSEVLKLQLGNIDWKNQALVIQETKFFKSRIVPIAPGVMKELENYLQLRQQIGLAINDQSALFQNPHRKSHYSKTAAQYMFNKLLVQTNIKNSRKFTRPYIHSLRHTMAVHRIEDWYRQGQDVQSKLGLLSTYLGHVNLSSTQRYLTMTTQLLQQAAKRFRNYVREEDKK